MHCNQSACCMPACCPPRKVLHVVCHTICLLKAFIRHLYPVTTAQSCSLCLACMQKDPSRSILLASEHPTL